VTVTPKLAVAVPPHVLVTVTVTVHDPAAMALIWTMPVALGEA
jgi:hypothetical protein